MRFRKPTQEEVRRHSGYVSYTPQQLREDAANDSSNAKAYELLYDAMTTSSKISEKEKSRGKDNIKNIYPTTKEQSEQMRQLLDEAYYAASNPDEPTFASRYSELRDIANWSQTRHDTTQILPMFAVGLIFIFSVFNVIGQMFTACDSSVRSYEERIEDWEEIEVSFKYDGFNRFSKFKLDRFDDARSYKHYTLTSLRDSAEISKRRSREALKSADTTTLASAKEELIARTEGYDNVAKKYVDEFDRVNALSFKELQNEAISQTNKTNTFVYIIGNIIITLFFGGILWLYNKSQQSYGYTISRHRFERKIIDRIQRFMEWITIKMLKFVGYDLFVEDHSTTTDYVDASGRVAYSKENTDWFAFIVNSIVLFVQIMVFVLVSIIAMLSSSILIIILTIHGLHCNYGWRNIFSKIKDKIVSAIDNLKEVKSEIKETQEDKSNK